MTIVAAVVAWFFIVDFPQLAKFLSRDERANAIERLNKDRGDGEHDQITGAKIIQHLRDWKLWGFALIVLALLVTNLIYSSLEQLLHAMPWLISLRMALSKNICS
jgi:hypothetical protein